MKTEVRVINKELATEMLKKNFSNRKLSIPHVRFLSKQMVEGAWCFDGQPIRFDIFGRLLDGQHRLNAIVHSETDQQFLIVSGIKSESFQVMDTGKCRNGGDVLSSMGVKYASDVSAIAKSVMIYDKGLGSNGGGGSKTTNAKIVSWYESNTEIVDIIRQADSLKSAFSSVLSRPYVAFLYHIFSKRDVVSAKHFMTALCHGTNIDPKSPTYVLRKLLIADRLSKSSMTILNKNAVVFKAWNAYRLEKKIQMLRWNKDTEKFPVLI